MLDFAFFKTGWTKNPNTKVSRDFIKEKPQKDHIRTYWWLLSAISEFAQSSCNAQLPGDHMQNFRGSNIKLEQAFQATLTPSLEEHTRNTEKEGQKWWWHKLTIPFKV